MNEELLQKAMQMFDTPEKWNAFCELMNRNGEIQNRWWKNLQTEIYQRELSTGNPDWDIKIWNFIEIKWFMRGENESSLLIYFRADGLRIYFNNNYLDVDKVNDLIKDQRFNIIKTCLEFDGSDSNTICWEERRFYFGNDTYKGKFRDDRTLAWYAGNRTKEFADQVIEKVRKIQIPEITALFKEINEKCRKDNTV